MRGWELVEVGKNWGESASLLLGGWTPLVAAESGVKCGETMLKSGEVRLEGVTCCSKKVE